jgi:hypothetical protein
MGPAANRTIRDNIAPSDPDQATRKAGTLPAFLREKAAHEAGAYDAAKAVAKLRPRLVPPENEAPAPSPARNERE